jgi:hypothetical protein
MKKIKAWLVDQFLPAYCRDDLLAQNARLLAANAEQKQEIERLQAYIDGLHTAIRRQPRIVIYGTEVNQK